ncbi:HET-domain-containing protein [Nemania sp. FL0916]|nr:HET-domain-containing protein [Nemania sp. FL0916]
MQNIDISEEAITTTRCPGNLCTYFSWRNGFSSEEEDIENLLHGSCEGCSLQTEQEPLCDFCRHLRLRHLIMCRDQEFADLRIDLDLGQYKPGSGILRIMSNTCCALCNFLAIAIRSYFLVSRRQDENEEDMRADTWLRLWRRHGYNTPALALEFSKSNKESKHKIEITFGHSSAYLRPSLGDRVSWAFAQKQIDRCSNHHNRRTKFKHSTMPQDFRLVDVDERRLLSDFTSDSKLGHDIKFAALSYVWGKPGTSTNNALLSSNKHKLTAPRGLDNLRLPKAFEDAIIVCQKLKQRFLWVDRLCIQQDDDGPENQAQINAMGNIYSSAEFTIIHAGGFSMEDPIAGVTTTRQCFRSRTVVCGLELILGYPDIIVQLGGSRWNERGWVYQEAVLSRRKLFFTPVELWFECSDGGLGYQREARDSEWVPHKAYVLSDSGELHTMKLRTKNTPKLKDFVRHLESYTARSLTYRSDILDAFKGILTVLYKGGLIIHGLPETDFGEALLWYCSANRGPTVRASSFPSWSWPSATGIVTIRTHPLDYGQFLSTLVQWYYQDGKGELKMVKTKSSFRRWRDRRRGFEPHLLVAWWKKCLEPAIPESVMQELKKCPAACVSNDGIKRSKTNPHFVEQIWGHIKHAKYCPTCELLIKQRWPYLKGVWKYIERDQKFGYQDIQHLTASARGEERQLVEQLHPGVLLTRAQTTILKASTDKVPSGNTNVCLTNSTGGRIGRILPTNIEMGLEEFLDDTEPEEAPQSVLFECMGVSLSTSQLGRARTAVVDVLVIQRKESSPFWRRIAVGWVRLSDWLEADRTFKMIGLE